MHNSITQVWRSKYELLMLTAFDPVIFVPASFVSTGRVRSEASGFQKKGCRRQVAHTIQQEWRIMDLKQLLTTKRVQVHGHPLPFRNVAVPAVIRFKRFEPLDCCRFNTAEGQQLQ